MSLTIVLAGNYRQARGWIARQDERDLRAYLIVTDVRAIMGRLTASCPRVVVGTFYMRPDAFDVLRALEVTDRHGGGTPGLQLNP